MRITKEAISRFVNESIAHRALAQRDLIAVYLCGSFLGEDFLLGGAADIDLVFLYVGTPEVDREVVRFTEEIHLDIIHNSERDYRDTRRLRVDPWRGPTINECKILYDPQHYLDFVQASVRGQFDRPDHVHQRAMQFANQGRSSWFHLNEGSLISELERTGTYLEAVSSAANALASLNGPPLTDRRLLIDFPQRAEAAGYAGLYQGVLGLLGAPELKIETLGVWKDVWEKGYQSIPENDCPIEFHPARLRYYLGALEEIISSERSYAALWLLLKTWTEITAAHPENSTAHTNWRQAFEDLGLVGPEFEQRTEALDAFLDTVEETVENWGEQHGV